MKRITTADWIANVVDAEDAAIAARRGWAIGQPGDRIPEPPETVTSELSILFDRPRNDTPLDLHAQRMGWDES